MTYETFADVLNVHLLTYLPSLRDYVSKLKQPTKEAWHNLCRDASVEDLVQACVEMRGVEMAHYEFGNLGQRIAAKCDKYEAERRRKADSQKQIEMARYYENATEPVQQQMLNIKALDARLDEEIGKLPPVTASAAIDPVAHAEQIQARTDCRRRRMQRAKEIARQFMKGS